MGSAVKALRAAGQHKLGCSVWILYDLIVPKAHDDPALTIEKRCPAIIIGRGICVLAAVQFRSALVELFLSSRAFLVRSSGMRFIPAT